MLDATLRGAADTKVDACCQAALDAIETAARAGPEGLMGATTSSGSGGGAEVDLFAAAAGVGRGRASRLPKAPHGRAGPPAPATDCL